VRGRAAGMSIIDQLAPRLIDEVERASQSNVRSFRLRTLLFGASGIVAAVALAAWLSFTAGEATGVTNGEIAAQTMSAAMAAGPRAAAAWSSLMADHDPVQALAPCRKSASTASDGRHYCSMPLWLDRVIKPE